MASSVWVPTTAELEKLQGEVELMTSTSRQLTESAARMDEVLPERIINQSRHGLFLFRARTATRLVGDLNHAVKRLAEALSAVQESAREEGR